MPVWSRDPSTLWTTLSPMKLACCGVADAIKCAMGCLNAGHDYECTPVMNDSVVVSGSVDSLCVVDGVKVSPDNDAVDTQTETPDVQSGSGENVPNNRGQKRVHSEEKCKANVRKR